MKRKMDVNHETAMRLWVMSFGKKSKAKDFAGREIAKGAYNDRNSEFGWNIDHILPQSRGGKTADYNLVCCHIKTNDEKADKFPCFNANGRKFEIVKVQNHYEIKSTENKAEQDVQSSQDLNLYDSAAGIRFYKKLKGMQNKKRFVGSVLIRLNNIQNTAVVDFIEEIFENEHISFVPYQTCNYGLYTGSKKDVCILVKDYDLPLKDDTNNLLDKCVLLNTYLSYYFRELECVSNYEIDFALECFDDKFDMYQARNPFAQIGNNLDNSLFINELVVDNTEAKEKISAVSGEFVEYDYVFSTLADNLKKEVEGR